MKKIIIAIDGPSAAGKSTIAKLLAKKYSYVYVDTGAMYRCVAYYALNKHIDLKNENDVCSILAQIHIDMRPDGTIFLNKENVSDAIRSNEISLAASIVSAYKDVREFLVFQQRKLAENGGVVLDGRDIGTVVLPNAQLKIYQVASVETRALRRYRENIERNIPSDLETIKKEIEERDYNDINRKESPLRKADDAILLDTSNMSIDEVIQVISKYVDEKREEV